MANLKNTDRMIEEEKDRYIVCVRERDWERDKQMEKERERDRWRKRERERWRKRERDEEREREIERWLWFGWAEKLLIVAKFKIWFVCLAQKKKKKVWEGASVALYNGSRYLFSIHD